jgi:hypothetical protein
MTRRAQAGLIVLVAVAAVGSWIWHTYASPEERAVRGRLDALAAEFNAATTDGLGTAIRAARLGQYFTEKVVVELGQGSPPIHGRETLVGMAARLQPRTAAFVLELDDVTIQLVDAARADVALTVVIRRRSMASGEESLDAREFSAEMQKDGGEWRISRVVAVDTLR